MLWFIHYLARPLLFLTKNMNKPSAYRQDK
jgi:hypothetical protein